MTTRRATRHHPHRGHKMSAAAKRRLSARLKGRKYSGRHHKGLHHKGHKLTAAQKRALSARLRGRHHRGHKMTAAQRAHLSARLKGRKHPHKGAKATHPRRPGMHHTTRRTTARSGHRLKHFRRGRIYPSHFKHRHSRGTNRFGHRKHPRALRASYVAGRRHVRAWK